jgi:hypothetical protein
MIRKYSSIFKFIFKKIKKLIFFINMTVLINSLNPFLFKKIVRNVKTINLFFFSSEKGLMSIVFRRNGIIVFSTTFHCLLMIFNFIVKLF